MDLLSWRMRSKTRLAADTRSGWRSSRSWLVRESGFPHQLGRPADADQQSIRPADADFVEAPFAVAQDAAGTDDQIVHPGSDGVDVGRADENAEGVVLLRHTPRAGSRLGQVHLTTPACHDDILGLA